MKVIKDLNKIVMAEIFAPIYLMENGKKIRIDEWCNNRCGQIDCGFGGTHKEVKKHIAENKEAPHNWDGSCEECKVKA